MHHSVSYIVWSFHFNRLILLYVMQESKSGCFFLNTVYNVRRLRIFFFLKYTRWITASAFRMDPADAKPFISPLASLWHYRKPFENLLKPFTFSVRSMIIKIVTDWTTFIWISLFRAVEAGVVMRADFGKRNCAVWTSPTSLWWTLIWN